MKRFEINQEIKLLRLFKNIFSAETDSWTEEEAISKQVVIIDPANVLMCTAVSEEAKRLLCRFKNREQEEKKEPELEYTSTELAVSSFSMEYMNKIMSIMSLGEKIKITNKKDFPITIENVHFRFILAPRVED
jgi:hypothetical protein